MLGPTGLVCNGHLETPELKAGLQMLSDFKQKFEALKTPSADADRSWYQKRGKEFEKVISDLLQSEGLEPRTSYRPSGEELDGSFVMGGKFFLLEAKWHKDTLPASAIYQFKAKVDGKLVGTLGVFISMSGYSKDTVEAVRLGKTLNIILFDGDDFEACVSEKTTFPKVLRAKLRRAAETGEIYFPYKTEVTLQSSFSDILFVVEGYTDQAIISQLTSKILERQHLERNIDFIVAMGKIGVANLANSTQFSSPANTKVVFVVDSDGDEEKTKRMLAEHLEYSEDNILIIHPAIEAWLFPTDEDYIKYLNVNLAAGRQMLLRQLNNIDVGKLEATSKSFKKFAKLLIE
jgi:hypothetical protein